MLLEEREHIILSNINSNGTATVRQLAEACDVAEVTVRRDLKRLEENNLFKSHRHKAAMVRLSAD